MTTANQYQQRIDDFLEKYDDIIGNNVEFTMDVGNKLKKRLDEAMMGWNIEIQRREQSEVELQNKIDRLEAQFQVLEKFIKERGYTLILDVVDKLKSLEKENEQVIINSRPMTPEEKASIIEFFMSQYKKGE